MSGPRTTPVPGPSPPRAEDCDRAARYSAEHGGVSLLVIHHGELLWEAYARSGGADRPHDIASGTKGLTGLMAVLAASDGLLALDEPVVRTIPEWENDPARHRISLRALIQLISGMEAGAKPGRTPGYEAALATPLVAPPMTRFFYGAAPFQVFGEVLRRKLQPFCPDPVTYLRARLLDRIGVEVSRWRNGPDGNPNLSAGASLTARSWARLGQWIADCGRWEGRQLLPAEVLDECWRGTGPNPAYGLGWWLNAPLGESQRAVLIQQALGLDDLWEEPGIPRDLVYAAGAGKQRLYLSRVHQVIVVRQTSGVAEALIRGEHSGFSDRVFLRLLFGRVDA